jgi:hypothetical protein
MMLTEIARPPWSLIHTMGSSGAVGSRVNMASCGCEFRRSPRAAGKDARNDETCPHEM